MKHTYETPLYLVRDFDFNAATTEQKSQYLQELDDLWEALLFGSFEDRAYLANRIAVALRDIPEEPEEV